METNKENIIDYGKWSCPKSWEELDLKTFQEIERYYSDKEKDFDIRDVLHILCHRTIDEVNALPLDFSEKIVEKLEWLTKAPDYDDATNEIVIDGEKYIINYKQKLKFGEFVAADAAMKQDKYNYAAILAILCRKEGEVYDSKFENEVLPSRLEMFERQPIMNVMPTVSFFLQLYVASQKNFQLSSLVEEAIDQERKYIETLGKNGRLSPLSTKFAMKKLRKLEKSINSI